MRPDVSLVIINYRSCGLLRNCLRGFYERLPSVSCEVLVVDNDSRDGSVEMARAEFPQARVLANPRNGGFAYGANAGLKEAAGKYVLVMNADIVFMGGEIDGLFAWMEARPHVGMVGPKLLNPDKSVQFSCRRFLGVIKTILARRSPLRGSAWGRKLSDWHLMKEFSHDADRAVDWITGAAMFARMDAVREVGLMDERFFMYYEDVDWCRRFWEKKRPVWYAANAKLIHFHFQDSSSAPWYHVATDWYARTHFLSGLRYAWKWRRKPEFHAE